MKWLTLIVITALAVVGVERLFQESAGVSSTAYPGSAWESESTKSQAFRPRRREHALSGLFAKSPHLITTSWEITSVMSSG